jgi:hypothetical protein
MRNMLHVIVKNGIVIGVVELARWPWTPPRLLEEEGEYKVEYYHSCIHKTEAEHDARCWRE